MAYPLGKWQYDRGRASLTLACAHCGQPLLYVSASHVPDAVPASAQAIFADGLFHEPHDDGLFARMPHAQQRPGALRRYFAHPPAGVTVVRDGDVFGDGETVQSIGARQTWWMHTRATVGAQWVTIAQAVPYGRIRKIRCPDCRDLTEVPHLG
jgi:hypothetical protein